MKQRKNRRQFLTDATLAGLGFWVAGGLQAADSKSANNKLNVAVIGAGGQGAGDTNVVAGLGENIVALCDVDDERAKGQFEKYPKAARYKDFRVMFDKQKDIDAVIVATPDHTHAIASVTAMKLGKHVYCEKPLTHDVYEARVMRETASHYKVATQMGNQGTNELGLRRAVELIRAGVVGPIHEVHVWTNRPIWPQGQWAPRESKPVPKTLDWDLWLGTAPARPYHPSYCPFAWRGWWDFGTGALGDMACHTANMAFMALKLGYPTSVEAESSGLNPYSFPKWSTITYRFPARDDMPPVKWVWYDGKKTKIHKDGKRTEEKNLPPVDLPGQKSDSGCIMIGKYGMLYSPNDYGARYYLVLNDEFTSFTAPKPYLPRTKGHHKEWVDACKGGPPGMANFDYAAFLTEVVVLGNVALRLARKIEWDGPNMKAANCPEAEQY
ncbi:MAG TPA: Gfo/Idh/MocA family oxidoreductase, partial [Gemmataceae bacterium]|nr:Gfo/Idh/MocA family oxidoreductase [Gemmataceae bacterium]